MTGQTQTEGSDDVSTTTTSYTISQDESELATSESNDTEGWSPYEPCPHCGGERFQQLEVGDTTVIARNAEGINYRTNGPASDASILEVACDDCGETLWQHMAVQLIFSEFTARPFYSLAGVSPPIFIEVGSKSTKTESRSVARERRESGIISN